MQARRDREWRKRANQHVAIRFLAHQATLQDGLGQLFDKKRHAIGALDKLGNDFIGQGFACDLRDQRHPFAAIQSADVQHGDVRLTDPRRLELGTERHHQQDGQPAHPLDDKFEQLA